MNNREEELWEYIRSLQAEVDRLMEQDAARLRRIDRLERDRQVLRKRLDEAKGKRWPRFGRGSNSASETEPDTENQPPTLVVPGVGTITESPLPSNPPKRMLDVATILDPISSTVFAPEFQSRPLTADSWEETFDETTPDLLLVESVYSGHNGSWSTRVARFGSPSSHLRRLVTWCRSRSIPTAFWNKEDPINFEWFIESASLFDYVFTVDADQVPRYQAVLGHTRIGVLPFFAQPDIHFPGPDESRMGTVAFTGSYFAAKHSERRQQMEFVLDPARDFGLHIFDRHAGTDDDRFRWPDRYQPHIRGGLTYLQAVEAYRKYRVFLNVNTVTDSPTMCARRVFELAACGTPILSGPARALDPLEEAGAVVVTRSRDETAAALRRLLESPDERHAIATRAREWVWDGNTASDRVDSLLAAVGIA